ncbi:MAG: TraR/DksA family transcriptional regulator [Pseudomonadales bacterium]|nr:TraR/DksA family transcriptional regulator [Pseudomonadales bacterium]
MDEAKVREKLLAMKQELFGRVDRTHKHIHHKDKRVSANFAEQSVEMENQQLVYALDEEGRRELRQIDRALARLDEGSYGECVKCGRAIAEGRLAALPYTELCIECASAGEK